MAKFRRIRSWQLGAVLLLVLASKTSSVRAASVVPPNAFPDGAAQDDEQQQEPNDNDVVQTEQASSATPEEQTTEQAHPNQASADGTLKCRWGEHCPETTQQQPPLKHSTTTTTSTSSNASTSDPNAAFVTNKSGTATPTNKSPPEGFRITARVYTDPDDKLAHFDTNELILEYWECGVMGSTTSPLSVKHAYFRHALPRAEPNLWSGTEYGTHPQLLIPLKPLELLLNSGEHQQFLPGNVILLEDVIQGGHKIRSHDSDLSALLLTLPQHYHHVGKDRTSLLKEDSNKALWGCTTSQDNRLLNARARKVVFGGIGLGLSSLVSFFLIKVAPLWLSVGVGGMCFLTGGTYAAVTCGEYIYQQVDLALEKQRLSKVEVMSEIEEDVEEEEQ